MFGFEIKLLQCGWESGNWTGSDYILELTELYRYAAFEWFTKIKHKESRYGWFYVQIERSAKKFAWTNLKLSS